MNTLARGLAPFCLAEHGAYAGKLAASTAAYPAVWRIGQLGTGVLSDRGRWRLPIVAGMLVRACVLGLLVAGAGRFGPVRATVAGPTAASGLLFLILTTNSRRRPAWLPT